MALGARGIAAVARRCEQAGGAEPLPPPRAVLAAPNQIRYEVPSAIRNARRTERAIPQLGRQAIANFLELSIVMYDDASLLSGGYEEALRFGCSFYDGLYLALAESLDCPLIFADQRLRNGLDADFSLAVWLTDDVPPR